METIKNSKALAMLPVLAVAVVLGVGPGPAPAPAAQYIPFNDFQTLV